MLVEGRMHNLEVRAALKQQADRSKLRAALKQQAYRTQGDASHHLLKVQTPLPLETYKVLLTRLLWKGKAKPKLADRSGFEPPIL